jgi:hypothetical protein
VLLPLKQIFVITQFHRIVVALPFYIINRISDKIPMEEKQKL